MHKACLFTNRDVASDTISTPQKHTRNPNLQIFSYFSHLYRVEKWENLYAKIATIKVWEGSFWGEKWRILLLKLSSNILQNFLHHAHFSYRIKEIVEQHSKKKFTTKVFGILSNYFHFN